MLFAISFPAVAEMGKPGHFMGKCLGGEERELFKRETSLTTPIFLTAVRTMQARTIAPSNIRRVFSPSLPPSKVPKPNSQNQTPGLTHTPLHSCCSKEEQAGTKNRGETRNFPNNQTAETQLKQCENDSFESSFLPGCAFNRSLLRDVRRRHVPATAALPQAAHFA